MPLPINVTALVHGKAVESERIELKAGWNAEEVARTLCAFANDFQNWRGGDQIIERSFKGPLSTTRHDALNYLRNNVVVHYTRKVPGRAEAEAYTNVHYPAIEEALVNAVYHRSYEEREPIEVQITPEEITLLSFPGPDAALSMEALRKGRAVARRYRNRRIGEFLKELDLTEGRGTGIPQIIKSMRA